MFDKRVLLHNVLFRMETDAAANLGGIAGIHTVQLERFVEVDEATGNETVISEKMLDPVPENFATLAKRLRVADMEAAIAFFQIEIETRV